MIKSRVKVIRNYFFNSTFDIIIKIYQIFFSHIFKLILQYKSVNILYLKNVWNKD